MLIINKGFTLVELLVVSAIIIIMAAFVFPNFRAGDTAYGLQRSAAKLAQDLRRAEEHALSAIAPAGVHADFKGGYGLNFKVGDSSYVLFTDFNNNKVLDIGETLEIISLEKAIISNLSTSPAAVNIVFLPPDPQVFISGGLTGQIILSVKDDAVKTKIIKVNQAGLIYVE